MEGTPGNGDLIRYLQGEISFETWFEQQGKTGPASSGEKAGTSKPPKAPQNVNLVTPEQHDESASVFSSWGNAFTTSFSGGGLEPGNNSTTSSVVDLSMADRTTSAASNIMFEDGGDYEEEEVNEEEDDYDDDEDETFGILQLGKTKEI